MLTQRVATYYFYFDDSPCWLLTLDLNIFSFHFLDMLPVLDLLLERLSVTTTRKSTSFQCTEILSMTLGMSEFVISGLCFLHCAIRFISIKWDQEDKRRTGRKGVNHINLTNKTNKPKPYKHADMHAGHCPSNTNDPL